MHVTIITVEVNREHRENLLLATRVNHEASVLEPGKVQFDPNTWVLYETYVDKESAASHKDMAHYLIWMDTVSIWMASPRKGVGYNGLYPIILA